jgi:AAA15 family ATPase/GTPase
MLDSITIQNFKAIQGEPLELKNLAPINYLVGPNGCGKSSVLEGIKLKNSFPKHFPNARIQFFDNLNNPMKDTLIKSEYLFQVKGILNTNINIKDPYNNDNQIQDYIYRFDQISQDYQIKNSSYVDFNFLQEFEFKNVKISENANFNANFIESFKEFSTFFKLGWSNVQKALADPDLGEKNMKIKISDDLNFDFIAGGYKYLLKLWIILDNLIYVLENESQEIIKLILIEEPETQLHPKLQKKLPLIFERFTKENNQIKIFVVTHSPFIISAAAKEEGQKVYLIDKGHQVGLDYDIDWTEEKKKKYFDNYRGQGKNGYSGDNCLNVVSKMLGAGLSDLTGGGRSNEKANFIYCEGKDAQIYQTIFPVDEEKSQNIFFGDKKGGMGAKQVINSYLRGKDAVPLAMGKNVKTMFLIDSSCNKKVGGIDIGEGKDNLIFTDDEKVVFEDEERKKILNYYTECGFSPRVLIRKEIENYLFDPTVVEKFNENKQKKDKIILNTEIDYQKEVKDKLGKHKKEMRIYLQLAQIIRDHSEELSIYTELKNCIFKE